MRKLALFALALLVLTFAAAASIQAQTYSVLYNFGSKSGDPFDPFYSGIIAQGRDGNLYSTTGLGGANDQGAVFKITPKGTVKVLYSFDGTLAGNPEGGLTLGTDGNFYGTTILGGTSRYGTIFKVTPNGRLTVLYNFTNGTDGGVPYAPPVQGRDGNFYGTTCQCDGAAGYGTIYKITPSGTFTSLYQFDFTHGAYPYAPLVQGTNGKFYGTADGGGTTGWGVVFEITPAGKLTVLYNFDPNSGIHGASPIAPLVQGKDGNLYGTTSTGSGPAVIFKITPTGSITVLHAMNEQTDGDTPYAGLVQATDGNFYGANGGGAGDIFEVTPKGTFSVLYNFDGPTGSQPYVTPFQHTNGVIYGDTFEGGTGDVTCPAGSCGVFYSLNASLPAFVSLLPYSGSVGNTIEFLGQGLTGTTAVSFHGTAAHFTIKSNTYLTATVPSGATTGFVTVTTPDGTLKSNKTFRVTP